MRTFRPLFAALAAIQFYVSVASVSEASTFNPLGHLPGSTRSRATAVSGDGTVVVGETFSRAFRWTIDGGMVDLGVESQRSLPTGISFDGSVIVGRPGFLWSDDEGTKYIPLSPRDVSVDGRVVVGQGNDEFAARWTEEEGLDRLPLPFIAAWDSGVAEAVSADGRVIVGAGIVGGNGTPFRWTDDSDGDGDALFRRDQVTQNTLDLSADGSVVVGSIGRWEAFVGFRWTDQQGRVDLEPPPRPIGEAASAARAVSADGSIIVGNMSIPGGIDLQDHTAAIWEEGHGWRSIQQMLIDSGEDMTGWHLTFATDISADGTILVGEAINPEGNREA